MTTTEEILHTLDKIDHTGVRSAAVPPRIRGWLWLCNGGMDVGELITWVRSKYPAFKTVLAKRVQFPKETFGIYSSAYGFITPQIERVIDAMPTRKL